jgi:hypothetical protein
MFRWEKLTLTHPCLLNASQWDNWKTKLINAILKFRRTTLEYVTEVCEDYHPIDSNALVIESEEDLRALLNERIVRPKNFPLQDDA